ncbi:plexin [Acrasis kona]|uniref:Plexin n=1 Tax=Acrasis kona TaxID=1008807 RepID=A0AAW2YZZ6_9EUKA
MFEIVSKSNQVTTDARKQAKHLERRMVFFISWNRDIPDGYLLAKLKLEECKNEELKMKKELENFNVKKDKIQTTLIEEI